MRIPRSGPQRAQSGALLREYQLNPQPDGCPCLRFMLSYIASLEFGASRLPPNSLCVEYMESRWQAERDTV